MSSVSCVLSVWGSKDKHEDFAYFDSFSTSVLKLSFSRFQSISQSYSKDITIGFRV